MNVLVFVVEGGFLLLRLDDASDAGEEPKSQDEDERYLGA